MALSYASFDTSFSIDCIHFFFISIERVVIMFSIRDRMSSTEVSCHSWPGGLRATGLADANLFEFCNVLIVFIMTIHREGGDNQEI
mmetsp:Transcript_50451/g.157551  ORF Transcript_50451/g.157551 Transcript_50451/m.157551 type:complete len:86 (-) Transcript_50451:179-436(-)